MLYIYFKISYDDGRFFKLIMICLFYNDLFIFVCLPHEAVNDGESYLDLFIQVF